MCGADKIGREARKKIVEEAVAFANAYGGALVLGIRESEDEAKPRVAEEITAIPRCADLAERLNLVFRDWVDPQIPRIEIFAVPTCGDSGVVVIRTGRSRMAPHRVKPTRKCPIRRSDRCEEMTMREIQDLTLNLSRGLERLERRLARRSERFAEELNSLESPDQAYGIRVTAAPVGEDIQFERVYGEDKLYEPWHSVSLSTDKSETKLEIPLWGSLWRPVLRGARCENFGRPSGDQLEIYREIHCDGVIEIGIVDCRLQRPGVHDLLILDCEWLMFAFANLLVWADRVRNEASAPTMEYAVDVELYVRSDDVHIRGYGRNIFLHSYELLKRDTSSVKYPGELLGEARYSLREPDGISDVIALFERDFWNSIGQDVGQGKRKFEIEYWT